MGAGRGGARNEIGEVKKVGMGKLLLVLHCEQS